ncbi:MAG TPA: ATP-binding protein, partial [Acetobacteraceae bacterium]|nr:ATP-binding protein [Acetobacteraceae bacterium]
ADTLFDTILGRAQSDVDKAKVWSLRIKLYQVAGKYDAGLAVAREALSHFGVTFPDSDEDIGLAVAAQLREVPVNLNGRPIAALLDAPVVVEPVTRAIIDLLVDAVPCAYIARPAYFPLATLEAVNRSMRHGNTDQSSYAYAVYAIMAVAVVGDISSALQFSEMSLKLNEKFDNRRLKGTLLHLHGDHVNFWRRHFATGMPILEQAFNACLDVGDLVYAGFLAFETVWQVIEKGDALQDVLALSERYAAFTQQSHNDAVYETIRMEQRFVASLQGLTRDPLNFDGETFDEAASFDAIQKAAFGCGVVFHHIMKLILGVLYGRYREAMAAAALAEPVLGAAMAMPSEATYHFYLALAITALYPDAPAAEQETYRRRLEQILAKLEHWADNSPENYRNRHALVAAELARIDGRELEAMRLYEAAIRSAHDAGFVQNEAIANELAGRCCLGLGLDTAGLAYIRNARDCYATWGAAGKVKQLESRHSRLAASEMQRPAPAVGTQAQQLDAATVVKASQALSGEMLMPRLIERLMTIALQNAGADRGLLILPHDGDYRVEAEAEASGASVVLRRGPGAGPTFPEAIVRYVIRSHERVILDDATKPNLFSDDAYLSERQPRSVLCLPLLRQGTLGGLLYLENTLASHVFTPDRAALLELLASQAAISLENTRLYGDLQEREARVRRLVESNIIGIFIWDLEGQIIEANDAFLRMVDRGRNDIAAGLMRWTELTPAEWREQDARAVAELRAAGTMETVEKEFFRRDGSRVPVLLGAAAFGERTDQGVAFVIDLSDRKRAENDARESERRYGEIQMALAHASRVATMGQLSASIAHEVNQPISAAVTNAHAALRWLQHVPPNLDEVRMALERIAKDANRAGDVVGRIRAMVRKTPERKEGLDINEAIREVIALARGEVARNGVSVATDLADGLPRIDGDRVQLQQVLLNLMINGIEAMAAVAAGSRRLLLRSGRAEPGVLVVAVHDTGPGLDPAHLERVFEAFYTTKPDGLGMGLSICRSIVEAHGGRLSAGANRPRGTVFQFTLPLPGDGS